jgi:hypothetical protein
MDEDKTMTVSEEAALTYWLLSHLHLEDGVIDFKQLEETDDLIITYGDAKYLVGLFKSRL